MNEACRLQGIVAQWAVRPGGVVVGCGAQDVDVGICVIDTRVAFARGRCEYILADFAPEFLLPRRLAALHGHRSQRQPFVTQ